MNIVNQGPLTGTSASLDGLRDKRRDSHGDLVNLMLSKCNKQALKFFALKTTKEAVKT